MLTARSCNRRSGRQTEALYVEEGQFNPHLARSQKKKQKRAAKQAKQPETGDDSAYDFSVLEEDGEDADDMAVTDKA